MIILDVGGLVVGLEGLDQELEGSARLRYGAFLVDRSPELTLELDARGDGAHRPPGDPAVTRMGEQEFEITYGALVATLDLASGRGTAVLPPSIWVIDSLLRMSVGLMLAERGGLLVHGSGVRLPDGALVCFGPSGVGKTTVAQSVEPETVLCDEMIALVPDGAGIRAHGTPFHGDYPVCAPRSAPLLGLFRLVQGSEDTLEPLTTAQGAQALLGSTLFFCRDEALSDALLSTALRTCSGRTYRLTFQRGTHVPSFIVKRLGSAAPDAFQEDARPRSRR